MNQDPEDPTIDLGAETVVSARRVEQERQAIRPDVGAEPEAEKIQPWLCEIESRISGLCGLPYGKGWVLASIDCRKVTRSSLSSGLVSVSTPPVPAERCVTFSKYLLQGLRFTAMQIRCCGKY